MKVVLVYDEPTARAPGTSLPDDFGAEYEDARTIDALLEAISAGGHEAAGLALAVDFAQRITDLQPDLVFNIAEGIRGPSRESIVPALLDHLDIPYTGSNGLSLAISLDKAITKTLAAQQGVKTPAFRCVRHETDIAALDLPFPLFVKPNAEGSSMGISDASRADTPEQLKQRVRYILRQYRQDCLVETFAPGREFCVGILGNDPPETLPIVEVRTQADIYTYQDKSQHHKALICPADLSADLTQQMQDMALTVFDTLRCRDLARVDFRLDANDQPTFLEINPLPGLSPYYSIFPHQATKAGITYQQLIRRIIQAAAGRSR